MDAKKVFTQECKPEQVHWGTERGTRVAQAARDLGMANNVLGRLVRYAAYARSRAISGRRAMTREDGQMAPLPKALAWTRTQPGIPK
jgi:transposase